MTNTYAKPPKKDLMDFYVGQLKKYVGWTIKRIVRTPKNLSEDESFFGIELIKPNSKNKAIVWILRDDEGNGHGSFNVDEVNSS